MAAKAMYVDNKSDLETLVEKYDYTRFTIGDMQGAGRSKMIPRENAKAFLKKGIGMFIGVVTLGPTSEVTPVNDVIDTHSHNAIVKPEAGTLRNVPWSNKYSMCDILCEVRLEDDSYHPCTPRYVARQQLQRLESLGYYTRSAFEFEFSLYNKEPFKPVVKGKDIYSNVKMAPFRDILLDIEQMYKKSGISIEAIENEYGPGQFEMAMIPQIGIETADDMFRMKCCLKEFLECAYPDLKAVTMSKPELGEACTGAHFNHSLLSTKDKSNAFYDPSKHDNLSDVALYWIGGQMKHIAAIAALVCPTVNCYRRMHQPFAPDLENWGIGNRNAAYRMKNDGVESTYLENRMPSSASNPYIAMAATIAAGIDGIHNKILPPKQNDYQAPKLQSNLLEALDALKNDQVLKDALGSQFIEWFIQMKEQTEIPFCDVKFPETYAAYKAERDLYLDLV